MEEVDEIGDASGETEAEIEEEDIGESVGVAGDDVGKIFEGWDG